MATASATSKISPVVVDLNGLPATTFVATKVTGPDSKGDYNTEVIQYSDAKGGGAKVIGERDSETGELRFNDNASAITKKFGSEIKKASNSQMDSIEDQVTQNAIDRQNLNRASGKKNQDNTNGNTDSSQSKATPAPRNESGMLNDMMVPTGVARERYSMNLCYPVAMRSNLQDNLKITVRKHQPKKLEGGLKFVSEKKGDPIGSVILPMPTSIQDGNKTSWGSGTMTPMQMAASGAVKGFLGEGGMGDAMKSAEKSLGQFQTGGGEKAMENFFTEQLTGAEDLLSRTEGAVMNPNMELLFKGPSLRTFSFSWKMSPRDAKESVEIAKIIRMFKQSMAPQKTEQGLFLKAPNIYELRLQKGKDRNPFLPRIKSCALTDCSVNYTPDGSFMSYDNHSMVAYEMSLSFQETDPIYNNDYGSGYGAIGY